MGRPLNKKYFGNRNQGVGGYQTGPLGNSQNYADDHIGGEGILAIIADTEHGDVLINSSYPAPVLVKPAPTIPGGVTSTSRVIWEVDRVALTSGGANYEHTGLPVNFTLTGLGGGVVGSVASVGAGPGYPATTAGLNFTGPGSNRGEFVDTPPTAALTYEVCTPVNVTGGGDNAQCQVFFRVKRIEVLTSGSGYTGDETFSWNTAGCSGSPFPGVPTFTKTVDTGRPGSATNQENAIIIHANTSAGGTTAKVGDIIKQTATRNYKVKTADGIKVCKLGTTDTPAPKGAYITATDDNGNTYFVTKLTAHRVTLVQWDQNGTSPWLYATGNDIAKWSFTSTSAPAFGDLGTVLIENA